jgi:hypothetical protein
MVRRLIDGAAVDRWCGGGDCAAVVRRKGWHFQGLLAAGGIKKVRFKKGGILKVCRTFYWCSTVFTCTYLCDRARCDGYMETATVEEDWLS